ncbi:MAG TPA: metallophosphoesterase, partial [Candidatus Deferrimicrobium sp.]|nr:metallophosphoesterase [Candidatus Deferrimicrobium sp.]
MRVFLPLIFAVFVILFFGLIEILLLRFLNRTWWAHRWVRAAGWGLPLFGTAMVLVWGLAEYYTQSWLVNPAAFLAMLTLICEISLMLSLPVSGMIHLAQRGVERYVRRKRVAGSRPPDPRRRVFLKAAAAGLPAVTLSMGVSGLTRAFADVRVYLRPITFGGLPPALHGLRILHLSDLHLRHYVTLDDLEDVLKRAAHFTPHLVLVTGDISDDLSLLPTALTM